MGKMILLVVLGSYMVIGVLMQRNNQSANDAINNVIEYYGWANARHIASSGANMAVSNLFKDNTWRTGYSNVSLSNGTLDVSVFTDTSLGVRGVRVVSVGRYLGYYDTTVVELNVAFFSKYLMYMNTDPGVYFITGDTINGAMHTNDYLYVSGRPVFKGKVTMAKGPYRTSGSTNPQFWGGYEYGVNIPMLSSNIDVIKAAAIAHGFYHDGETWITMDGSSNVKIRYTSGGADSTVPLSSLTSNGTICINGDVHLKGKIDGSVTIASLIPSGSSTKGNVYIDDDIGVHDDPRTNPASSQYLGIVSQKNIVVTDNTANDHDCNITASLYATGEFNAQNYGSRGYCGYLNLYGSLAQYNRGAVGTFSGGSISSGFNKNYKYDDRLFKNAPPNFPVTDRFQILRWWE
ncbi:MAG: hypothetical protein Q8903_03345 [Bacteroidota bacterium]|nr:hypothetical protein [Bacteroidota bacterium]